MGCITSCVTSYPHHNEQVFDRIYRKDRMGRLRRLGIIIDLTCFLLAIKHKTPISAIGEADPILPLL